VPSVRAIDGIPSDGPPDTGAPLALWLDWIDAVHPHEMELGLARVGRVAARLGLSEPPLVVVTVGGTNGKGSTVAMLEAIWTAAGYRTGAATSPHVRRFNERMRVAGREAEDTAIVRALARVEAAREARDGESDTLTYFEFATLGAMSLFVESGCDVAIMEVGLGGRLDAVNLWDTDCAVLTSIALDHAEWLGTDIAVIATEKAAIGRPGRPLVLGERAPPASLEGYVRTHGIELVDVGRQAPESLPRTSLAGLHQRRNAACALAAVRALESRLPVADSLAREALGNVGLAARFEERTLGSVPSAMQASDSPSEGTPTTLVIDVAHNPAGAAELVATWRARFGTIRGVAVFAALADKDIEGIAEALASIVDHWCCPALGAGRAIAPEALAARVRAGLERARVLERDGGGRSVTAVSERGSTTVPAPIALETFASAGEALARALALAGRERLPILVCGSFVTVTAVLDALGE